VAYAISVLSSLISSTLTISYLIEREDISLLSFPLVGINLQIGIEWANTAIKMIEEYIKK